ncbi:hypothetical protein ADINL_1645 [Nitrincola lacisaponensis]|uniref:Tellurite resistance protein n=1 Tax=Nitrincola lacisaponensis TaxID=267850 RepID=A0A063Y133_9GAMM|nr:toxic anion resistance protein [Nitrincola lacisaponensis]KDE40008.1 hypothetical protein ADINL_1645 [Nitrincola lacisaponensis]
MSQPLQLPSPEQLAESLAQEQPQPDTDQVAQAAAQFVEQLLAAEAVTQRQQIDRLGLEHQQASSRLTQLLNTPLAELSGQSGNAQDVTQSLEALRSVLKQLKPDARQLESNHWTARLGQLVGQAPVQRYFRRYETAQDKLNQLISGLQAGRDRLTRDAITLSHDQQDMHQALAGLNFAVLLGCSIDDLLVNKIENNELDSESKVFVEDELLFPLRQRVLDLQQQQAICQQGILSVELIIRNNRELVRGVDRALNVTLSALRVAVTVALALTQQKLVLNHIDALNDTTEEMISTTAEALRRQGTAIQQRAATAQLDLQTLEQAFGDMQAALEEVSLYRREALPRLQAQIERMRVLTEQGSSK